MFNRTWILILLGFQAFRVMLYLTKKWQVEKESASQGLQMEDISTLRLPPPEKLGPLVEEMEGLGFTRLGEVQFSTFNPPLRAWLFVDDSHVTTSELFLQLNPDAPPTGGFGTMFREGYVLTNFNQPDPYMTREVHDPDFRAQNVAGSLADAYRVHQQEVAEMRAELGSPVESHTVGDYLNKSEFYMERFFPRRRTARTLPNSVLAAQIAAVGDITLSVLLLGAALLAPSQQVRDVLVVIAIVLPLIAMWIIRRSLSRFFGEERLKKL